MYDSTYYYLFTSQSNKSSQEFYYYPFPVKRNRCVGSCNTLNDLSDKSSVPNKTRFKSKRVKHDYKNKWIKKINTDYILPM